MSEKHLPKPAQRDAWKSGSPVRVEGEGMIAVVQCWIYQTWARLTNAGVPARLVHQFPEKGILVVFTGNLSPQFRPPDDVFVVAIVADNKLHPRVHMHVLQNPAHAKRMRGAVYMPHWAQPNLIPRDPARGDRFESVCFFGHEANLCPELRDPGFVEKLKAEAGVTLSVIGAEKWNDYSSTDCAIAIRDFDGRRHDHKPPTKLANAWLAGVPFLGGVDTAFASEGEPGTDFLVCPSRSAMVEHIRTLKADPALRARLVAAGRLAGQRHTAEAHTRQWITLLGNNVPALSEAWQRKSAMSRRIFFASQKIRLAVDQILMR